MVVKKFTSESLGITIDVDFDKCTGCGECVNICPTETYELIDGKAHATKIDDCVQCCACVSACPEGAIVHSSC